MTSFPLTRLLRSILSVKDEFYHRHIIQFNLFLPMFDLFRSISVGDNLVSSAILEVSFLYALLVEDITYQTLAQTIAFFRYVTSLEQRKSNH